MATRLEQNSDPVRWVDAWPVRGLSQPEKATNVRARFNGRTAARRQAGRPTRPQAGEQGLVLDDFLHQVEFARRSFTMLQPSFGLRDVESQPGAKGALAKLVRDTVSTHDGQVCANPSPLLAELGEEVYGESVSTRIYSGRTITPEGIENVLRRVLELGLQTVVQLPPRDAKPEYISKKVLSLGAALTKFGGKVSRALRERELLERIHLILGEDHANRSRVTQIGEEIQWAGEALQAIAGRKLQRLRLGSPNPQVRFALYLARWIHACTGSQHYALLKALTQAAFHSADKTVPKWVERLEIEMHFQKNHRTKWIRTMCS